MDIEEYQQLGLSIKGSRNVREILRNKNLKSIIDNTTDAIAIYDLDGKILYTNSTFGDIFGWKFRDISKNHTTIPRDEIDIFRNILNQAKSGKTIRNYKYKSRSRRLHKNGTVIHVMITALPLYKKNGEIGAILEMFSEITDRDIEKSDTDKGDLYSKIVEKSSDGIFIGQHPPMYLPYNRLVLIYNQIKEFHSYHLSVAVSKDFFHCTICKFYNSIPYYEYAITALFNYF